MKKSLLALGLLLFVTHYSWAQCITDQTVSLVIPTLCDSGASDVNIGSSQLGIRYFLRNNADDSVIDGPLAGTGSGIKLTTDSISASKTYNVFAEKQQSGIDLDSIDDRVVFSPMTPFDNTGDYTVMGWLKTNSNNNFHNIASWSDSTTFGYNLFDIQFGKLRLYVYRNASWSSLKSTINVNDGVWHHFAFTKGNNDTVKIYIDGVLNKQDTMHMTDNSYNINAFGSTNSFSTWQGIGGMSIDNFSVWDTALAVSDIVNNMTNCLKGDESGLQAYYNCNDGTGTTTLSDLTGGGSTGTLYNMDELTDWVDGALGCDSCEMEMTQTVTLTINQSQVTNQSPSICAEDSIIVGSNVYKTTGVYADTLTGINNCDSIVNTNLTVRSAITGSQTLTICNEDSVVVGSNVYKTTGVYIDVFTAADGCDSTYTTNLTVSPAIATAQSPLICAEDSVVVGSNVYKTTGNYVDVLTAANGCDSTVTTNLTVKKANDHLQTLTLCAEDSVVVGSNVYKTTGIYVDVLTGADGCDSTVTTDLTMDNPITGSQTLTICNEDSVVIGSNVYKTTGVYVDVFTAANGCDSTYTTNLTVSPAIVGAQSVTICAEDSLIVGSSVYKTTGIYIDVLTAANGCDSTVTTTLAVSNAITNTQNLTICAEDSVVVGSSVYNTTGNYVDVLTAANGCDSTVTTNLTVDPAIVGSTSPSICAGDSVVVGSNVYKTTGSYIDVFTAANGCDSTHTTDLTVKAAIDTSVTVVGNKVSSMEGGATYQWLDCDDSNMPIAGATDSTYEVTSSGNYAVQITKDGCTATSACVNMIFTFMEVNGERKMITVFPNPTSDKITLDLSNFDVVEEVLLTSVSGKVIYQQANISATNLILDLEEEAQGIYLLRISSEGISQMIQVVKQ